MLINAFWMFKFYLYSFPDEIYTVEFVHKFVCGTGILTGMGNTIGINIIDQYFGLQYQVLVSIRPANSDFFVKSKFGNQKSKTESELNSEIRFNRIRI